MVSGGQVSIRLDFARATLFMMVYDFTVQAIHLSDILSCGICRGGGQGVRFVSTCVPSNVVGICFHDTLGC